MPNPEANPASRLKAVVDRLPSMLACWDRDLRCRFANRAYEKWFGVDPDRLIGTSIRDLLGPVVFAQNEPYMRAALAGSEQTFERVVVGADGVARHSLATYVPDVEDGQVVGFIASVTEVTQLKNTEWQLQGVILSLEAEAAKRREAESRLVDAEASLAVTLASIEAGFIATDRQGRVTRINATAEALLGWTQEEGRGRAYWDVLVREDRPGELLGRNPVDVMIEQGITVETAHQAVLIARDGQRHPVEARAALLRARDGSVQGLAMVLRDLSHARQARLDFNRLVAIIESSQDAIIGKTLDGHITDWNPAAQTLFGYSAAEALGMPVQRLIPPEHQGKEMRILADLARGLRVPPFETQRLAKDGRQIDVSVTISPIRDADGRIVGASKIARDVSAQRRAEEARVKADRLEAENRQVQEASRLKSLFLANMSHELRTPLNAIIGFAELLHAGVVKPDSPKHQVFLGHIGTSGRHLLQLINDVLDLSKVESGKFEFFPEAVELPLLAAEVGDTLRPAAECKRLSLDVDVATDLGPVVLDPSRLKQVLYNFLSNAIKFTPAGGRISVRVLAQDVLHLRLEVEDTGIGIEAAQVPRLFIEFQQIDSSHSKQHEGTGLGLALTRRLVEAQGGRVGVRSEPGRGSVFHAVLNRVHGTDAAMRGDLPVEGEPAGHQLLVIEHDPAVQARMLGSLSAAGFRVNSAHSAEQALQRARQGRYDAITLDLRLPALQGGLGLLADIRQQGHSRQAPVVGVSVLADAGGVVSFAIDNILAKPLRTAEVAAALSRFAGRQGAGAPVMVIDDDPLALALMGSTLQAIGLSASSHLDGRQALLEIDAVAPCAIVLDLMMPGFDGFAVLHALQALPRWRATPVFIWTSLLLTDAEYALLHRSAQAILGEGGGTLNVMLDRLRSWRPAATAAPTAPAMPAADGR